MVIRDANTVTAGMKSLLFSTWTGHLPRASHRSMPRWPRLFNKLLDVIKVAVISGGNWPQFQKQVLSHLGDDQRLNSLSLLPTCGTQFFQYQKGWVQLYAENFTDDQKKKIVGSMKQAIEQTGLKPEKVWGEVIEDRGSQITFLRLGPGSSPRGKSELGPRIHQAEEDENHP